MDATNKNLQNVNEIKKIEIDWNWFKKNWLNYRFEIVHSQFKTVFYSISLNFSKFLLVASWLFVENC